MHKATCRWCQRSIGWHERSRMWLAATPVKALGGDTNRQRLICALSPSGTYHAPAG